jgi:hypothetical protein
MKTYGYITLALALYSLYASIFVSAGWMPGLLITSYLSWKFLSAPYYEKECTVVTKGKVIDIKANGTFLGGMHQPLHNAHISYLDRIKEFKDLPPNFIHDVSPGDVINIKYNARKPHIAFVDFL